MSRSLSPSYKGNNSNPNRMKTFKLTWNISMYIFFVIFSFDVHSCLGFETQFWGWHDTLRCAAHKNGMKLSPATERTVIVYYKFRRMMSELSWCYYCRIIRKILFRHLPVHSIQRNSIHRWEPRCVRLSWCLSLQLLITIRVHITRSHLKPKLTHHKHTQWNTKHYIILIFYRWVADNSPFIAFHFNIIIVYLGFFHLMCRMYIAYVVRIYVVIRFQ